MESTNDKFDNNALQMTPLSDNGHNTAPGDKPNETVDKIQTKMPNTKIESELESLNDLKLGKYVQPHGGNPAAVRCTRNVPMKWQRKILKLIRRDDITVENAPALYLYHKKLGLKVPSKINKLMTKHKLKKIGFTPADSIMSWSLLFMSEPAAERYKTLWQKNNPTRDFDSLVLLLNSSANEFYDKEKERTTMKRQLEKHDGKGNDSSAGDTDSDDNDDNDSNNSDSEHSSLSIPNKKARKSENETSADKSMALLRSRKPPPKRMQQSPQNPTAPPYAIPPPGTYNAYYRPPPHPMYANRRHGSEVFPPYDPYYNFW